MNDNGKEKEKKIINYLRLVSNKEKNKNKLFSYKFLIWIALIFPVLISSLLVGEDIINKGSRSEFLLIFIIVNSISCIASLFIYLKRRFIKKKLKLTPNVSTVSYPGWCEENDGADRSEFKIFSFGDTPMPGSWMRKKELLALAKANGLKAIRGNPVSFPSTFSGIKFNYDTTVQGMKLRIFITATVSISFTGEPYPFALFSNYGFSKKSKQDFKKQLSAFINSNIMYSFDNKYKTAESSDAAVLSDENKTLNMQKKIQEGGTERKRIERNTDRTFDMIREQYCGRTMDGGIPVAVSHNSSKTVSISITLNNISKTDIKFKRQVKPSG